MRTTVVLDIDGSAGIQPGQQSIALSEWQEALRFGCTLRVMRRFRHLLDEELPLNYGTVLLGSGDFHHLSWPLIARLRTHQPFQVVVLDNHPDNMRYLFGVHCGSWVRRVAALPTVSHVHVVGITSDDIGPAHAWEHYRRPLREGRLSYWSIGVDVGWARKAGLHDVFHTFSSSTELVQAFAAHQARQSCLTYLSIDKDVFSPEVARTNWDQGCFMLEDALAVISSLRHGSLVGSDITGEVSNYHYRSWWKRVLSHVDGQSAVDEQQLPIWQAQQQSLNRELLHAIETLPVATIGVDCRE